jgi:hypothetical protein
MGAGVSINHELLNYLWDTYDQNPLAVYPKLAYFWTPIIM